MGIQYPGASLGANSFNGINQFKAPVLIGAGTLPTATVDLTVYETINSGYAEVRIARTAAFFRADYFHSDLPFDEAWALTGSIAFDRSPKPLDGVSDATIQFFRNTTTSGLVGLGVYKGDASASINAWLSGTANSNSYINGLAGNGLFGVGHALPLATLHAQGDRGSVDKEIARFTESLGGTAIGMGLFVDDNGNTKVSLRNKYTGNVGAALVLGFGNTLGTFDALVLTKDLNAVFGGSIITSAPNGGTAGAWKTGIRVAATVALDTTQYIQLDVGGTLYKVGIVS